MSPDLYNEEHLNFLKKKIVEIANRILCENVGVVTGVRELVYSVPVASRVFGDPDFNFLVGIESETDHLPMGEVRKQWSPEALKAKDGELAAYEANVKERVFAVCRRLIEKYNSN